MKESNYKNGFQTNKKRKGKTVTTVIVLLLVTSLMLGVVGYFRTDIMDLINPTFIPMVEEPVIEEPIVEEPINLTPDPDPVISDTTPDSDPRPAVKLLVAGSSADSIYVNTDTFDTQVKAKLASLEYEQSPDYMGIGYKFLTVPVDIGLDENVDFQFVIVPFMRLFNCLGYDTVSEGLSEDDFFMLIYCGKLNDWAFNNVFYSSVTADLEFINEEGSINLVFYKGFRSLGISADGKVNLQDIINIDVYNRYSNFNYIVGNIEMVDSVIAPVAFAAEKLVKNSSEKTVLMEGENVTDLYFNYVNFQDILSAKDSYINQNLNTFSNSYFSFYENALCVAEFRVSASNLENDLVIPFLLLPITDFSVWATSRCPYIMAKSGEFVDFTKPITLLNGSENAYLLSMERQGSDYYYCSESILFGCTDQDGIETQFAFSNSFFSSGGINYFDFEIGKVHWPDKFNYQSLNNVSVTIENLYHSELFNLLFEVE